jgi:hypothetical protein
MGITYVDRRSRVRIDVRAANVHAALHIQHRRPNGCADRGPNRYKHSLGQWAEVMGVGDRECSLMRALRAHTCAQYHLSSIGAQRAGPIEPKIGTKTHWGNGHKLRGRRARREHTGRRCLPQHERGARTSAKSESTGMEQGATTAASAKCESGAGCAHIERSAQQNKSIISDRHRC